MMVVPDGNLDNALGELPVGLRLLLPEGFERFMAFEEVLTVELVNSFEELGMTLWLSWQVASMHSLPAARLNRITEAALLTFTRYGHHLY